MRLSDVHTHLKAWVVALLRFIEINLYFQIGEEVHRLLDLPGCYCSSGGEDWVSSRGLRRMAVICALRLRRFDIEHLTNWNKGGL